jgi:hypothetical protein
MSKVVSFTELEAHSSKENLWIAMHGKGMKLVQKTILKKSADQK